MVKECIRCKVPKGAKEFNRYGNGKSDLTCVSCRREIKRENKLMVKCLFCNKEFETTKYRIRVGRSRFCSHSCSAKFRQGDKNPNWRGEGRIVNCICVCGKEFQATKYQIQKGQGVACSDECRFKLHSNRWQSGFFEGIFQGEELKQKRSKSMKARWAKGEMIKSRSVSPTSIETALSLCLDSLSIEHRSQYIPLGCSRIYDEYIKPDVLIEVHGDYWHANPLFYDDSELYEWQKRARINDVIKAKWAVKNGYQLVVIWENEIKKQGILPLVTERVLPILKAVKND